MREQGKHKLAVERLSPFLQQPHVAVSAAVHAALIHLHIDLGQLARAQELVKSLAELEPEGYRSPYLMGQILLRMDLWEKARDAFRVAVKKDPGMAIAWRELLKCFARTGEHPTGLACIQYLANQTWPVKWRRMWIYHRGVLYQQMANYSLALVSFAQLVLDCLTEGMPAAAPRPSVLSQVPPSAPRTALGDAIDMLERRGMQPFPSAGTLLGWWREGDFLGHDKDIDIMLPAGSDWEQVPTAVADAPEFKLIPSDMRFSNFVTLQHRATGLVVDITHHEDAADGNVGCVWRIPGVPDEQCRRTQQTAYRLVRDTWLDREFWRPEDPDRFLTDVYGDWRTPMVTFDTVISGHHLLGYPDSVRCYAYNRMSQALMEGDRNKGLSYADQIMRKDPLDPLALEARKALSGDRDKEHAS